MRGPLAILDNVSCALAVILHHRFRELAASFQPRIWRFVSKLLKEWTILGHKGGGAQKAGREEEAPEKAPFNQKDVWTPEKEALV